MSKKDTTVEAMLAEEYREFNELLAVIEKCLADRNFAAAAGLAQMTARRAFPTHIGIFASPRLERLVLELGRRGVRNLAPRREDNAGRARKVLHILTYARQVGGDTRFVWRWVKLDENSRHSVVITSQNEVERVHSIPEPLKETVARSGGFVCALSARSLQPLERAGELRALCRGMDMVVLHTYPNDIVPLLALASGCDSVKVAFSHLSDHTFWMGASVSNLIVHLRTQSPSFLSGRRGLNPVEAPVLPIPLEFPGAEPERATARRELGFEPNQVILLTIASPFKYESLGGPAFLDLVMPVMRRLPQAHLIAVGPEMSGAWHSASIDTNGRVRPIGTKWDNDLLYRAADVYLDSYPFSSITSLLEAGSQGVPLLSCRAPDPDLRLLGPGAPGLDNSIQMADGPEAYDRLLARLITDVEFRHECGERVRASILSSHCDKQWLAALNDIYRRLEKDCHEKALAAESDCFQMGVLDLTLARLYAAWERKGFPAEIGEALSHVPYLSRIVVLNRLRRRGFRPELLQFLPSRIAHALRRLTRQVLRTA